MFPYLSFCRIFRRNSTINYYSFHKNPNRINRYLNSFELKTWFNVSFKVYEIPKMIATFEIHVTAQNNLQVSILVEVVAWNVSSLFHLSSSYCLTLSAIAATNPAPLPLPSSLKNV